MTPLSHSAAHEELADLALEPAALRRLVQAVTDTARETDPEPLAAHIAGCADCRSEIANWERVHGTVHAALQEPQGAVTLGDLARAEPIRAPATLRASVRALATSAAGTGGTAASANAASGTAASGAAASAAEGSGAQAATEIAPPVSIGVGASRPRLSLSMRLLPLVAVLAVVVVAGNMLVNQAHSLDKATADAAALAAVTATLDRVILDPGHQAIELRAADGSSGGSVVWSSQDLVVLTTGLSAPPADVAYRCWIERDGKRSPIGRMFFANGTGYWTGSLDAWATTSLEAGSTFGISLEPVAGSVGSPAVLEAQLGS